MCTELEEGPCQQRWQSLNPLQRGVQTWVAYLIGLVLCKQCKLIYLRLTEQIWGVSKVMADILASPYNLHRTTDTTRPNPSPFYFLWHLLWSTLKTICSLVVIWSWCYLQHNSVHEFFIWNVFYYTLKNLTNPTNTIKQKVRSTLKRNWNNNELTCMADTCWYRCLDIPAPLSCQGLS